MLEQGLEAQVEQHLGAERHVHTAVAQGTSQWLQTAQVEHAPGQDEFVGAAGAGNGAVFATVFRQMAAFGTCAAGGLRGDVFHGRVHAQGQKRVGENGRFCAVALDGVGHRTVPEHSKNFVFYDNFSDLSL